MRSVAPRATPAAAGKTKPAYKKADPSSSAAKKPFSSSSKKPAAGKESEEKKKVAAIPQNHKEQYALKLERRRFENPGKFELIKEAKGAFSLRK